MMCTKCGKPLPDDAKFCANCGAVVGAAPAPPPVGFAPPPGVSAAPTTGSGELLKGLIERVTAIVLRPGSEWPVIAAEPSTARDIYLRYVAPLVAIGVIAMFIGHVFIGISVPLFGTMRVGIVSGLTHAVLTFVLTFVGVFLIALLVDALAPTFGGQRDALRALKVTAYSYTPAWVAGVLHVLPSLGMLVVLAALYGLYLLYLGLPVLMRCPKEKAVGYTAVIVLCAIVMGIIIGAVSAAMFGGWGIGMAGGGMHGRSAAGDQAAATDNAANALSQMLGGKTDADRARMSDALQSLAKAGAEAEKTGKTPGASGPTAVDPAAALAAVGTLMAGGAQVEPVDFRKLKELLPDALPGMTRSEASGQGGEAMGIKGSSATARYGDAAGGSITIEIADIGSLTGLAAMAAKFAPGMEKETDDGYERVRKIDGQILHEKYNRRTRSGEVSVLAGDRVAISVNGSGVDADALLVALKQVDLARLSTLVAATRK